MSQQTPHTVLIIRHGEKPEDVGDAHLSPKGHCRAAALSALFDAKHNGGAYPAIDALLATAYSKGEPSAGAHRQGVGGRARLGN